MRTFAQTLPSPGSLYLPGGSLSDATRDLRASRVDDVITIVVSESLSAVASGRDQLFAKIVGDQ